MSQFTLPGTPPVIVHLRRSSRARRLSLRVSQLDGRVTLTIPKRADQREAEAFAASKAEWVRKHLARRPDQESIGIGSCLPVQGRMREVVAGAGRSVEMTPDHLVVPDKAPASRVQAFLKETARQHLVQAVDFYAGRLGRGYAALSLRDTRSRWGSCSAQGRLMFSWRLILAPPPVLDYVAAHEVAHLKEMNHSPAFWNTVQQIHGPYERPRQWLRDNANELHRYRF